MAFLDIESKGFQYRLIVAHHRKVTPASQLPEHCTGILLEGGTNRRESLFDGLAGVDRPALALFRRQYPALRSEAQDQVIPLVAAEPLVAPEALSFKESNISLIDIIRIRFARRILFDLAAREGEVKAGDTDFTKAKEFITLYIGKNPRVLVKSKDLLFAERAETFAEFQARSGVRKPHLAVVVGALHLGTVEEIGISREERLAKILKSDLINSYYQSGNLGEIHYVTYSPKKHLWSGHVLSDHRFKRR